MYICDFPNGHCERSELFSEANFQSPREQDISQAVVARNCVPVSDWLNGRGSEVLKYVHLCIVLWHDIKLVMPSRSIFCLRFSHACMNR